MEILLAICALAALYALWRCGATRIDRLSRQERYLLARAVLRAHWAIPSADDCAAPGATSTPPCTHATQAQEAESGCAPKTAANKEAPSEAKT